MTLESIFSTLGLVRGHTWEMLVIKGSTHNRKLTSDSPPELALKCKGPLLGENCIAILLQEVEVRYKLSDIDSFCR